MKNTFIFLFVLVLAASCATYQQIPLRAGSPVPSLPPTPNGKSKVVPLLSPKAAELAKSLEKVAPPPIILPPSPTSNRWVVLSWPKQNASFTVFQRDSLAASVKWQVSTNVSTNSVMILIDPKTQARFFTTMANASATQSVALIWNKTTDPTVVGYRIYYGVSSRAYTNTVDAGNATNCTIFGLKVGTVYYFAATAYNILAMESSFSDELSYKIPGSTNSSGIATSIGTFPKLPTIITSPATNVTTTSAKLSGQVLNTGGALPITMFLYSTGDPYNDTNADWEGISVSGTSTNLVSQTVSNLMPSTTYYYVFAARNAAGIAEGGPPLSFTTTSAPKSLVPPKLQMSGAAMRKTVKSTTTRLPAANAPVLTNVVVPISFSVPAPPLGLRLN